MRILFIGSIRFSFEILDHLIKYNQNIVGVVSTKNKTINSDYANLSSLCYNKNIPLHFTNDINNIRSYNWIKNKKCDVIFCLGWNKLLKINVINLPLYGVVGYHPTDLPKNRGRHPIIWSIVLGLKNTSSTFFMIEKGVDSGPIVSKSYVKITNIDDSKTLYNKLIECAKKQVIQIINNFKNNKIKFIKQKNKNSNYWRKRKFEDGCIDWRMSNQNINQLIKALIKPYPGAHFTYKNSIVKVWKAKITNYSKSINLESGKVIKNNKGYLDIVCGEGVIRLLHYSPKIQIKIGEYL